MADGTRTSLADLARAPGLDPRLMAWLSSSFPVGAFAYSHGLETAAHRGWIVGRDGLIAWLRDLAEHGSLRNDLILLAVAHRHTQATDHAALADLNALALAFQPSAERHLEAVTQGNAFLQTIAAAWPCAGLEAVHETLRPDAAYPIAVGAVTALHAITLASALQAYGLSFVTNLTSAAIRLSVIGQTDGQRTIAALLDIIDTAARFAFTATLDDLGGAAYRSDIASLAHETQYTRLFRS